MSEAGRHDSWGGMFGEHRVEIYQTALKLVLGLIGVFVVVVFWNANDKLSTIGENVRVLSNSTRELKKLSEENRVTVTGIERDIKYLREESRRDDDEIKRRTEALEKRWERWDRLQDWKQRQK